MYVCICIHTCICIYLYIHPHLRREQGEFDVYILYTYIIFTQILYMRYIYVHMSCKYIYINTCLYVKTQFRNAKLSVHMRIQTYRSKGTNPHMQGERGKCGHHLQKYTHVYRWIHVCVRTSIPVRRGMKISSLVCK